MRDHDGQLSLRPAAARAGITRLEFSLLWRGLRLRSNVEPDRVTYSLRDGIELLADIPPQRARTSPWPTGKPVVEKISTLFRCCADRRILRDESPGIGYPARI